MKQSRRLAKKRGKDAETRIAKNLSGRKVMFSGAGVLEKGDVRVEDMDPQLFTEVKYSGEVRARDGAHTYSLNYEEVVEKTVLDAAAAGCVPVLAIVFGGREHTLYATRKEVFEELVRQSQELHRLRAELDRRFAVPLKPTPKLAHELPDEYRAARRRQLRAPAYSEDCE